MLFIYQEMKERKRKEKMGWDDEYMVTIHLSLPINNDIHVMRELTSASFR